MEVPPPDNASLDPPVATDIQVEEDEDKADVNNSTEMQNTWHFPRNANQCIVLNGDLLSSPKTSEYSYIVLQLQRRTLVEGNSKKMSEEEDSDGTSRK